MTRAEAGQAYLEHHGIKGMKWGVRKEQVSSPRKAKAGDPVTLAIGAAYAAIIIAALAPKIHEAVTYKKESGKKNQEATKDIPWKKNPELSKKMSVDELHDKVVKPVNPNYGAKGTKMNCRRCTFSYEMRRRGNDVRATPSIYATGQDYRGVRLATMSTSKAHYESLWGEKKVPSASPDERSKTIFDALNTQPEGARGELSVGWGVGGGHSMAYEVVNGKAVIFDTQSSVAYRTPESFSTQARIVHEAAYTRTDNVPLDEHFLRRWMTNV